MQCVRACQVASVMTSSVQLCGMQPARLLCPWDSPSKKYWSWLPCPPPGDLPDPEIKPASPKSPASHWQAVSLPLVPPGKQNKIPWLQILPLKLCGLILVK